MAIQPTVDEKEIDDLVGDTGRAIYIQNFGELNDDVRRELLKDLIPPKCVTYYPSTTTTTTTTTTTASTTTSTTTTTTPSPATTQPTASTETASK